MSCPSNCDKPLCPFRQQGKLASKPMVWILGGPGSGKGTQCAKICAKYGLTHISTGDLLRDEIKSGSARAKSLQATIAKGELIDNEIVLNLLKEAMLKKVNKTTGFLIDGYPREVSQGITFERTIAPATVIIFFETSIETMTKRIMGRGLTSGRADDNPETIKLRIKTFVENNNKVLHAHASKVVRISAEGDPDSVFREVEKVLDPIFLKGKQARVN